MGRLLRLAVKIAIADDLIYHLYAVHTSAARRPHTAIQEATGMAERKVKAAVQPIGMV
jgi:hypothetical protein